MPVKQDDLMNKNEIGICVSDYIKISEQMSPEAQLAKILTYDSWTL